MTHSQVLASSAALLNDQARQLYTDAILLAYYNIALAELQEIFELHNIPSTNETSAIINVPIGQSAIGFPPTPPIVGVAYLPSDLVEIQRLYCSSDGANNWVGPMVKKEFLTGEILPSSASNSFFNIWAWMDEEIRVLASTVELDLKLDYIKTLFPIPLVVGDLTGTLSVINAATALSYRAAGLACEYIEENPSKAQSLNSTGFSALERSLGIAIKGKQSMVIRRRPFRASFKRRGLLI